LKTVASKNDQSSSEQKQEDQQRVASINDPNVSKQEQVTSVSAGTPKSRKKEQQVPDKIDSETSSPSTTPKSEKRKKQRIKAEIRQ